MSEMAGKSEESAFKVLEQYKAGLRTKEEALEDLILIILEIPDKR